MAVAERYLDATLEQESQAAQHDTGAQLVMAVPGQGKFYSVIVYTYVYT